MKRIITKIKSSKLLNSGYIKKIKDKIYFSYINPREEKKTDRYRLEILEKFARICENCKWQLLSGGFLRFFRDKTMDGQDLDLFILNTDFEKVKNEFFKEGFKIKQIFMNAEGVITEYKFLYRNVEVDVFMMFKTDSTYWHSFTMEKNNAKKISKTVNGNEQIITGADYITYTRVLNEFKNVKKYEYNGVVFKGPKNANKMLIDLYGEGWTVYDPTFDPKTGPVNNPPSLEKNAKSIVFIEPIEHYNL